MKYLKVLIVAFVAVIAFGSAQAQVRVKVGVGHPVQRRVVVERRARWHRPYHRPYHRVYRRSSHRTVVVRHP